MSKNYSANIDIKTQNSIANLKKVMEYTAKLKKDLASISKNPITINAKMGSSFKNVQAQINKVAPKSKTVHFKATEDVTKKMSTINRQVFEMNKNIKTGLSGAMKGFNTSLNATLPKIQALSNGMALASNMARMSSAMAGASALGAAGAGAGTAALLSRRNRRPSNRGTDTSILPTIPTSNQVGGWMQKARNTLDRVARKIPTLMGPIADAFESGSPFLKKGQTVIGGGSFYANMLQKQKAKMDALNERGQQLGMKPRKNYLNKYSFEEDERIGETYITRNSSGMFEKMGNSMKSMASKMAPVFNDIKFKASIMLNEIKAKIAPFANYFKEKMSLAFGQIQLASKRAWNTVQTAGLKAFYSIQRGSYNIIWAISKPIMALGKSFMKVKETASKAFSSIKSTATKAFNSLPQPLQRGLTKAFSTVKSTASRAFSGVKSIANKTASAIKSSFSKMASSIGSSITKSIGGALSKVGSMASGVAKAGVAAAGAAIGIGANSMMNQEQTKVSMNHFMKVGDAKSNGSRTLSDEQINKKTNDYMDQLTAMANRTPFDNDDIYSSGRRMLQVFEGNTDMATKMTQMSADMAALNPGKTAQDASEALADLAMGETERMKEFGFKFSQDQLKQLIGKTDDSPLTGDETMKAFEMLTGDQGELTKTFKGGAADISGTTKGMFSTLWGTFKQVMATAMKPFEGMMKSAIKNSLDFLGVQVDDLTGKMTFTGMSKNIIDSFTTVANFMGDLFGGDASEFPIITNLINAFETLKSAITPIVDTLKGQFEEIFGSAEESFGGMGGVIEGVATVVANVIKGLTPILELLAPVFNFIKDVAIAVWPVIEGIITVCSQVIKDVVQKLKPVFEAVSSIIQIVGDTVADIWPKIQDTILSVWEKLQPVLDLFGSLCKLIAEVFSILWPPIAAVIETLWGIIGPILDGMASVLGKIAEWCTKVVDGLSGVIGKVKDSKWNPFNWFDGDKEEADGQHAAGLARVPRDGYKAILHEGERVLTANDARKADNGSGSTATQNVTINVNGSDDPEKVARLIVTKLKEAQVNLKPA